MTDVWGTLIRYKLQIRYESILELPNVFSTSKIRRLVRSYLFVRVLKLLLVC